MHKITGDRHYALWEYQLYLRSQSCTLARSEITTIKFNLRPTMTCRNRGLDYWSRGSWNDRPAIPRSASASRESSRYPSPTPTTPYLSLQQRRWYLDILSKWQAATTMLSRGRWLHNITRGKVVGSLFMVSSNPCCSFQRCKLSLYPANLNRESVRRNRVPRWYVLD